MVSVLLFITRPFQSFGESPHTFRGLHRSGINSFVNPSDVLCKIIHRLWFNYEGELYFLLERFEVVDFYQVAFYCNLGKYVNFLDWSSNLVIDAVVDYETTRVSAFQFRFSALATQTTP